MSQGLTLSSRARHASRLAPRPACGPSWLPALWNASTVPLSPLLFPQRAHGHSPCLLPFGVWTLELVIGLPVPVCFNCS